jgi:hypothetical protein
MTTNEDTLKLKYKQMIGLFNVDNTSDLNKPISNATQTGLDSKLNLVGGTLVGGLTGTTATFSGPLIANGGITGTTARFSGMLNASGGLTGSNATFSGLINANGGITGTTATFSGPINANGATLTAGLTGTTASFSGAINANGSNLTGALTGTSATFSDIVNTNGRLNATGGITGSNATFAGPIYAFGGITGTAATFTSQITANGGTLTDGLTGTTASFSGPINANGVNLTNGLTGTTASFSGAINANSSNLTGALTGTTATFSGIVNTNGRLNATGGITGSNATFAGPIFAFGGITGTAATFTSPITANGGTLTSGLTGTTATFSGPITANGSNLTAGLTGTTASFSGAINANGSNLTGALTGTTASFSGPITANGVNLNGGLTGTTASFSGIVNTNGMLNATGGLTGSNATFSGPITANGGITGTTATFSGPITANGGITGTTASFSGNLTVGGKINTSLMNYASNDLALTAGLPVGSMYKVDDIVKVVTSVQYQRWAGSGTTNFNTVQQFYKLNDKLNSSLSFTENAFDTTAFLRDSSYKFSYAAEFKLIRPNIYTDTDVSTTGVGANGSFFPLLDLYYNDTNSSFFIDQEWNSTSYIRGAGSREIFSWFDVTALTGSTTWWADNTTYYILINFTATQTTIRLSKLKAAQQFSGTTNGFTFPSYPVNIQGVYVGGTPKPNPDFYFRGTVNNIIFSSTELTWDQAFNGATIASVSSYYDNLIASKAPINNPTFTGTVSGITKTMVGLSNVDDTTDINKPISTATQTALNTKLNLTGGTLTGGLTGTTATFSGPINANGVNLNGGLTGTTASFSGAVNANSSNITGALTGTTATFSGIVNTNGRLNATGGITGSNATFAGPIYAFGGITGTAATFTSQITANGATLTNGLTGTTATFSGAINSNSSNITGALTGTTATFSGPIVANGGITGTTASFSGPITANGGTFTSSVTMNFSLNVLGSITAILPHYSTNLDAYNAGIPYMGLYRTGGIVKVRLDIVPPTITLLGSSNINLNYGLTYTDPGVTVTDNYDTNLPCYITSISSGSTNVLSNSIAVVGTTTTVSQTSTLPVGVYTITYNVFDTSGNIGLNTRTLNIAMPPSYYSFSGTSVTNSSAIGYSSNTQFMLGSGDFTIECFVRYQTLLTTVYPNPTSVLFDLWSTANGTDVIGAGDVTNLQIRFIFNGVSQNFAVQMAGGNYQSVFGNVPPANYKITQNVWYHTGCMRINNYMYIIHNGFISRNGGATSRTDITGYSFNGQRSIRIGNALNLGAFTGYLNGDISEIRISNIARYSGSGTNDTYYTVPERLTTDANTIFKLGDNYTDEVSSTILTNVGAIQSTKNYR